MTTTEAGATAPSENGTQSTRSTTPERQMRRIVIAAMLTT